MDELIARLRDKVGISEAAARRSVEVVIAFLASEAPAGTMNELAAGISGLEEVIAHLPAETALPASTRHFGGMARLMEAANRMMESGLTMSQVQQATHEVVCFARDKAGEDVVNRIVTAIPGLRQVA